MSAAMPASVTVELGQEGMDPVVPAPELAPGVVVDLRLFDLPTLLGKPALQFRRIVMELGGDGCQEVRCFDSGPATVRRTRGHLLQVPGIQVAQAVAGAGEVGQTPHEGDSGRGFMPADIVLGRGSCMLEYCGMKAQAM